MTMHRTLRTLRDSIRFPSLTALSVQAQVMARAEVMVAFYYSLFLFAAFFYATSDVMNRPNFEPLWTIGWANYFDYATVVYLVFAFILAAGIAGALFYRHRTIRVLVFLSMLEAHAFESSFGSPNHQWYLWVYSSLIFVFLPDIWTREGRERKDANRVFLLCIWCAQAVAMMVYTLAGYHKLYATAVQWWAGQVNGFSIDAFAYQIADWLPRLQAQALLGPYIIAHPTVGWLPYVAIQFIQFFSLWAMVRLGLQRVWAVVLIVFHIATYFTMGVSFHPLVLALIALFMYSPFVKEEYSLREFFLDLPVIGQVGEWWLRRRAA